MPPSRILFCVAAGVVLGIFQSVSVASPPEGDSVYQWGRWSVLSPAAGGAQPYAAVRTPGASFNARPGEASEFQPTVASVETQVSGGPGPGTPGVVPVNPGQPIVNLPPPPPPPPVSGTPGVVPVNPGQPIVNLPSPPPPGSGGGGVVPVNPGQPIVNLPSPLPPPVSGGAGVVPVNPGQPIVSLPSPLPPPGSGG